MRIYKADRFRSIRPADRRTAVAMSSYAGKKTRQVKRRKTSFPTRQD